MKVKTSPEEKPKKRGGIQPRNRTKYSALQLNAMESLFLMSQYPDSIAMEDLSKSLSVTIERISIWFQNRRSKFKRQSKDVHMAWMRKQIFNQDAPHQPTSTLPRLVDSRSSPDSCHVLSPPVEPTKLEPITKKPQSNLHYMPMTSTTYTTSPQPSTSPTTFTYPSFSQRSPSQSSYSPPSSNPLLMSHLLNDVTQPTAPGYQPCNYGNSNYGVYNVGNYPYYSQMNPYYSMNSQQAFSS